MVHIKGNRIKINYSFACVALCVLFMLQKTVLVDTVVFLRTIVDILQWPFLILMIYTMFESKIKKKSVIYYAWAIILLCLFFVSYLNSGLANIFKYTVIILAAHKQKDLEIFKTIRNAYCVLFSIIFILGLLRMIPSVIVRRGYFTYGFVHSNVLAMFVFSMICCDLIYCYRRNIRLRRLLSYIAIMVLVSWITDCRSVLVGFVVALFIFMILGKIKFGINKHRFVKSIVCIIPVVLSVVSFYFAYNYEVGNHFMELVNQLSTQRVFMANQLTKYYDLKILGQECSRLLVENAYLTVFFAWGIVPGIVTIGVYCYAINKSLLMYNYGLSAALLGFAFQGLFEGSTFELFLNLSLLATLIDYSNKRTKNI